MLLIPLKDLKDLARETGIQTKPCKRLWLVLDRSLWEVIVVKIIKLSVVLLGHISEPVKSLDTPKHRLDQPDNTQKSDLDYLLFV